MSLPNESSFATDFLFGLLLIVSGKKEWYTSEGKYKKESNKSFVLFLVLFVLVCIGLCWFVLVCFVLLLLLF